MSVSVTKYWSENTTGAYAGNFSNCCYSTTMKSGGATTDYTGATIYCGYPAGTGYNRAIFRFYGSNSPVYALAGKSITSAEFGVYCHTLTGTGGFAIATPYRLLLDWSYKAGGSSDYACWTYYDYDNTLNWNTAGAAATTATATEDSVYDRMSTSLDTGISPASTTWLQFDVTALIQDYADGNASDYGWILKAYAENSGHYGQYYSESGSDGYRWYLKVVYDVEETSFELPSIEVQGWASVGGNATVTLPSFTAVGHCGGHVDMDLPAITAEGEAFQGASANADIELPVFTAEARAGARADDLELPAVTCSAEAMVGAVASLDATLPKISASATAQYDPVVSTDITLPAFTVSAVAVVGGVAEVDITLPVIQVSAGATAIPYASASITLPSITVNGTGYANPTVEASVTLPAFTALDRGNYARCTSRFANKILRYERWPTND